MKSGLSGALKPDRLGCNANNCSDTGTGDLGVLTTHETTSRFSLGDAGSNKQAKLKVYVDESLVGSEPTM